MQSALKDKHQIIWLIYALMLCFFLFKMCFYMLYVGRFPDEMAHISYIAYLEENQCVIPEFKDMTLLKETGSNKEANALTVKMGYNHTYRLGKSFNYLGHPPLYYQLMRLSGGVSVKDGAVTVDILRLRCFSILLAAFSMLLMFHIGRTRLGNVPAVHLLYAAVCVSVPMLSYDCAGVNNDTLALLGSAVFLLGLLRFSEKKRDSATFMLIGCGVAVTLLAKLVAGMVISMSAVIFLYFTIKKEKRLRLETPASVLAALPACLFVLMYYVLVYKQTGTIQPTFRALCPGQFFASTFYVPPKQRYHFSFVQYARYYWDAFLRTWTGIYSYVELEKTGKFYALDQIGLILLWALPLPLFLQIRRKYHYPFIMTLLSLYMGLLLTAAYQFFRAYNEFKNVSGYLGGYQSRYYLCMIPFLALAAVSSVGFFYDSNVALLRRPHGRRSPVLSDRRMKIRRAAVVILCYGYTALLLYEDFIYFVLNFKAYL